MRSAICMASTAVWWAPPRSALCTGKGRDLPAAPSCVRRPPASVPCTIWWRSSSTRASPSRARPLAISGFGNVGLGRGARRLPSWAARWSPSPAPTATSTIPTASVTDEKINYLLEMRASGRDKVQDYADKFGCEFHARREALGRGRDRWTSCMPCATQNDVNMELRQEDRRQRRQVLHRSCQHAHHQRRSGVPEGAEATWSIAPSKAVNAGGVAAVRPGDGPERRAAVLDRRGSGRQDCIRS